MVGGNDAASPGPDGGDVVAQADPGVPAPLPGPNARIRTLAMLVSSLAGVQLLGIAASIAELVSMDARAWLLVAGILATAFSLVAIAQEQYTASRARVLVAALTFLVSGASLGFGLTGQGAADDAPSAAPSASTPVPAPTVGTARITSPANGAEVSTCRVEVRFEGQPAAGKAFLATTKQQDAAYYFEPQVERVDGQWAASVQLGQREVSADENYTISVYEIDQSWATYLTTVLAAAAKDWRVASEDDATYWSTMTVPPDADQALAQVQVHRTNRDDPTCPD